MCSNSRAELALLTLGVAILLLVELASPLRATQPTPGKRKVAIRLLASPNASAPLQLADFDTEVIDDYGPTISAYAPIDRLRELTMYANQRGAVVEQHDEYDILQTPTTTFDTRLTRAIPPDQGSVDNGAVKLYLVQFRGPIQQQWLEDVQHSGARIDRPLVTNGILAVTSASAAAGLARNPTVQWLHPYTPPMKPAPPFFPIRDIPVVVEIADEDGGQTRDRVQQLFRPGSNLTQTYTTTHPAVVGTINSENINRINAESLVVGIYERTPVQPSDERANISLLPRTPPWFTVDSYITEIAVTNTGSGYSLAPIVTIGGGATATVTVSQPSGRVTNVAPLLRGSGYTAAPTVQIDGGGGNGAAATAYWS